MPLIYATVILVFISIIILVIGKIKRNKIVKIIGSILLGIIIIFWIGFVFWSIDENDRQFKSQMNVQENKTVNESKIDIKEKNVSGNIIEVGEQYIVVQEVKEENKYKVNADVEEENKYKVNADIETNEFINERTTEKIKTSDIKVGDYYINKSILRNVTGKEWEEECIKNLAYCYEQGNLYCYPREIKSIQNMGNYVIMTLIMEDVTTKYFSNEDDAKSFELKALAYANLDIPTVSGNVTIYNLKEEVEGFMYWMGIDKNTINNKYPTINSIEIYDK